jgi:hypothetical protein
MPNKCNSYCAESGCPGIAEKGSYYCAIHKRVRLADYRQSAAKRGYDRNWQRIRVRVLRQSGIPREEWPKYDVDHNPPYDPATEPDHNKYTLIPRLHADHSRKTALENQTGRR